MLSHALPRCGWLLAALLVAPVRAATPGPVDPAADARAPDAVPDDPEADGARAGADAPSDDNTTPAHEPPTIAPVAAEDRRHLAELAASLPQHGVPAPSVPALSDDDDAWEALARALIEVFAPGSMRTAARDAMAATTRPLAPAIDALIPHHARYLALQRALVDAARGLGQAPIVIPKTPYTIRAGVTAPEVALLRDRLLLEGYGDPNVQGRLRNYFDPRLKRALWAWEKDHGLPVTVVLDPLTRRRLNAPLPNLVQPIALALRRWRQLGLREDAGRHVLVLLTEQRLVAETDGRQDLAMDVIIGRATAADATPAMSAPLVTVVAHPDWRVPKRIIDESLRPRVDDVPEILMDEGYEVRVTSAGEWRVRLPPGPANPLGEVKLILRGTAGVYLHDTNRPDLFDKATRTLSHGCVRVSKPRDLAAWAVAERRGELTRALDEGRDTVRFDLVPPLAVHLVYQTLSVTSDGRLTTHPDLYGRDAEALAELDVTGVAEALVPPAAEPPERVEPATPARTPSTETTDG